jgi:hypothetical protein
LLTSRRSLILDGKLGYALSVKPIWKRTLHKRMYCGGGKNRNAYIRQSAGDTPHIVRNTFGSRRGITTMVVRDADHLELRIRTSRIADNMRDRCSCYI